MGGKTEIPVTEPSVQLTQSDLLRLAGYRWDMTGFVQKQEMGSASGSITQQEAEHVFQLDPAPAKPEDLSCFVIAAQKNRDLRYISFFLHHYETAMNKQIRRFLLSNGIANQSERFLDMKLACMEVILKKFPDYDPEKNAAFATYLGKFLRDAILACRMQEEAWSLSSLSVYKGVRLMAAVYAQSHENMDAALESFIQRTHCTPETAKQYLKTARGIRARQNEFFINEDGEETEDEILIDNSWNYSELIWDGIRSSAIQDAFWKLRHRDQQLLERRNAICMQCRRVGHPSQRQSYEQLSALIQASTDKGTEKAYNSAVKKFEKKLIERGAVRLVKLKCISKTMGEEKIANATYRYQADCDGEWGEIYLDFEKHKGFDTLHWRKVIPYLRKENTGMFQDKVIVITGGANGIGKCIAEEFQKNGAHVCVIDQAEGDHYVGGLADKATLEDFAQTVIGKYGRVDVLVNNAPPLFLGLNECTYEQFQQSMAIGVTAPFYLSKLFAPYFAPGSSIINISSSRDRMSQPQSESYTAAKGGISALTHALAVSFAGKVRVNSISPGWIDTAYTVYEGPDAIQQPAGRVGNPLDIANMVLFLASDKAGFITGENICIDGGQTRLMIYHGDHGWTLNP